MIEGKKEGREEEKKEGLLTPLVLFRPYVFALGVCAAIRAGM